MARTSTLLITLETLQALPVTEAVGVYNAAMPDQANKAWVKTIISVEVK